MCKLALEGPLFAALRPQIESERLLSAKGSILPNWVNHRGIPQLKMFDSFLVMPDVYACVALDRCPISALRMV